VSGGVSGRDAFCSRRSPRAKTFEVASSVMGSCSETVVLPRRVGAVDPAVGLGDDLVGSLDQHGQVVEHPSDPSRVPPPAETVVL
jgi:hypothetical protein